MTGGQDSAGTHKLHSICEGIGVEPSHIRTITPISTGLQENIQIIREEIEYKGVSVIIAQRECVQVAIRNKKKNKTS